MCFHLQFLLTRPSRDVTKPREGTLNSPLISTHTPLAGRDVQRPLFRQDLFEFLLTRPSRDVTRRG